MEGITRLEDDLYAIDTPFAYLEGIHVRSYLLVGKESCALIDAGATGTGEQVLSLLAELGIPATKLRVILLTHAHGDHVGGLKVLRGATGCLVAVQKSGAELLRDLETMFWDFMQSFPDHFPLTDRMHELWFAIAGESAHPDIQFECDGFRLDIGGIVLDPKRAVGHSSDSVCFYEPVRQWLFTGDSICGRGPFTEPPCYRDATEYRETLERLSRLPVTRLFSAHFEAMDAARAHELFQVSLEMLDKVDAAIRTTLRKAHRPLRLEDIGEVVVDATGKQYMIQALFAAKAHLIELERMGFVEKYGSENALYGCVYGA